ncbi:putative hydrolase protein [Thozetella sp. PMI_491]|nr:putative hydrolase protein [Thozetella sp. PMI_491]
MVAVNHPTSHGPSATALLLLDYHEMLVDYMQDEAIRSKVISCAQTLLLTARKHGVPIFHCLVDKDGAPAPNSKLLDRWESMIKPSIAAKGAELADLAPPADKTEAKEWTFVRQPGHVSALKSPGLIAKLRDELGVKSLVLCGLSSSGCVLSTARNATDEDFVTSVAKDGCWDPKEGVHDTIMGVLEATGWVLSTDEALRILEGKTEAS